MLFLTNKFKLSFIVINRKYALLFDCYKSVFVGNSIRMRTRDPCDSLNFQKRCLQASTKRPFCGHCASCTIEKGVDTIEPSENPALNLIEGAASVSLFGSNSSGGMILRAMPELSNAAKSLILLQTLLNWYSSGIQKVSNDPHVVFNTSLNNSNCVSHSGAMAHCISS